ncbi:MAG: TonB C-terminal domain-containing protein [Myxococcales bacterium]|jgi:outer membrane biosynthesis protein TonB|nr:TonB C-terminal domain-containing protein [Myxococcales bacterium]
MTPLHDRRAPEALIPLVTALSVLLHALAIGGGVWLSMRVPPKLEPMQKVVTAKLVRQGKPRDDRLLPRKQTPPAPAPPPKAIEVPLPKTAPTPPPVQQAKAHPPQPKSQPKPSNTAALANAARRQGLFSAFAATAKPSDEAIGEADGDPEGDSDSAEEGERYFGLILAKARRHYGITKTISPQELIRLKAIVVLYIGTQGELIQEPELQKSSGNALFDQEVLMALKKAAPFGPPPANLAQTLRTVGIAIEATP